MPRLAGARKARLSVPRVQRPQRPRQGLAQRRAARPAYTPRSGLAQRTAVPPAPAVPAQPSATSVPTTQSQPTDPFKEAAPAAAPTPPKGLFGLPAWNKDMGGDDPRDASYWANVSKLKFSAEQDYARTQLEQQRADTDYNTTLQTAIRNRALEQRGLGENAIRGNLGNSGWLDRSEAEQTLGYTQERAAAQLGKTEEDAAREAARKAILQGYSLDAAAELGEAAARYAARKAEEAENAEGLAGESGGGEAASSGARGSVPRGKAGGPFFGRKGPGGYTQKRKRTGVSSARPAAPARKAALSRARRAR